MDSDDPGVGEEPGGREARERLTTGLTATESGPPPEAGQTRCVGPAQPTEMPQAVELPRLTPGLYLLNGDGRGAKMRPLQTLALDAALSAGGDAVWIDTRGYVATHSLARLAPSARVLRRVQVARAFTTHQHHTLVTQLARWVRGEPAGVFGEPATDEPAVVVVPAADGSYRSGELSETRRRRLFARTLAQLQFVAREAGVPVLTTRTAADELAAPLAAAATAIETRATQFGPRFDCSSLEFETVAYPEGDGTIQTTLAFWRELLASRHEVADGAAGGPSHGVAVEGGW